MVDAARAADDRPVSIAVWMLVDLLVPAALALALLATVPGKVVTATGVVVGETVLITLAAGDDDATAIGFALGFAPFYGVAGIVVAAVVERIVLAQIGRRRGPASFGDRLAALAVDATVVGLVAWRFAESADGVTQVAVPIEFALGYLFLGYATGGTPGHRSVGLRVVDHRSGGRLPVPASLLRAVVVFAEVGGLLICWGAFVALADLVSLSEPDGRSFADRLCRSRVQRHVEPD